MVRIPNDCERVNRQRLREIADLQAALKQAKEERDRLKMPVPDDPNPCPRCGRQYGLDATVSNEDWLRITGQKWGGGHLCLWCIDAQAIEKGLEGIHVTLTFAGRALWSNDDLVEEACQARAGRDAAIERGVQACAWTGSLSFTRHLWRSIALKHLGRAEAAEAKLLQGGSVVFTGLSVPKQEVDDAKAELATQGDKLRAAERDAAKKGAALEDAYEHIALKAGWKLEDFRKAITTITAEAQEEGD